MEFSLNCLISGQAIPFVISIGNKYVDNNGIDVYFDKLTVSHFKEQLFRRDSVKAVVQNSDSMDLCKVELDIKSLKVKNEDEIRSSGTMMDTTDYLAEYFNPTDKEPKSKCLHIFIIPTSTGKCLPTFYLSNKKFAVETMIYISSFINNIEYAF